ncbi:hypothetical protein EVAR_67050_1 [Eumeta japonica]|uniref:Uncharacterized protein n=1 Tax=Eumeta variegata TaxID=151549 RepID=A0A4C2A649_EUMVA|nr:hypothetical protein EVAR_67050_1 [Eumeta japonica]
MGKCRRKASNIDVTPQQRFGARGDTSEMKSAHRENSIRINIKSGRFPVGLPTVTSSLGCRIPLNKQLARLDSPASIAAAGARPDLVSPIPKSIAFQPARPASAHHNRGRIVFPSLFS